MVLNNEFTSLRSWRIGHIVSAPLHWMSLARHNFILFIKISYRCKLSFSTAILVGLVIKFHYHEIQIFMNANSAEDWKIALTLRRCLQISMEILICGVCPIPIDLDVYVTSVASDGRNVSSFTEFI
jgi:hypothetical protein